MSFVLCNSHASISGPPPNRLIRELLFLVALLFALDPLAMGDHLSTYFCCGISPEQGDECKQALALGASAWAWSPATDSHVSLAEEEQCREKEVSAHSKRDCGDTRPGRGHIILLLGNEN